MAMIPRSKSLRLYVFLGITSWILGCQNRGGSENIGKIEPDETPSKKVSTFDSARGCYTDAIVNGTTVNNANPLKNHVVMVLSRFQKGTGNNAEILTTLCTGTLISPHMVLTAGHCFPKNVISTQIIASINLYCSSGFNKRLVYPASKVTIHPDYRIKDNPSTSSPDYDVATVKFDGALPAEYSPIALKKFDVHQEMGNKDSELIMIGFGRTQTAVDSLPELRYLKKGWDRLLLSKDTLNLIETLSLVGVNQLDSRGGCSGDSGGPLLISEKGEYKILGVASYIEGQTESKLCEQGQIYYSYVPDYLEWITRQLQ